MVTVPQTAERKRGAQRACWAQLLVLLTVAALLLSGCGASRSVESAASEAPAAGRDTAEMLITDTSADSAMAQEGGALPAAAAQVAAMGRKMVARASLSMVVADAEQTVDDIELILKEVGGFISQSSLYNGGTADAPLMQGTVQLRVPVEQLETTLDRLEALAVQVGSRTLTRDDVTDQYSDIDAQLRNLEATENELLEMLAEARERRDATPDQILSIHYRVTEVRGQIEQLQGQQNLLDNMIDLSTVDVTMVPDLASLPVVEEGWRPGNVLRAATRSLVSTAQNLVNGAIWLVIAVLPIVLMLIFPLVVLVAFVRWIMMRRRGQKGITIRSQP